MAASGERPRARSQGGGQEEEGEWLCDGFLDKFAGLINKGNVQAILSEQDNMLETLEVANEKLSSLNSLSEKSFALHAADFRGYTRTVGNMKKELDSVFRRIRFLKARLAAQYPDAYSTAETALRAELEAEEEEEEDDR